MNIGPIAGMEQAEAQVTQAASRIAMLPAAVQGADSVDLSAEMVALIQARDSFAANVKSLEVMDEMTQNALDMVG